jgi:hypothetical protein
MSENTLTAVHVDWPQADPQDLKFSFGPSKINLRPGESDAWVVGTYQDLTGFLPVRVEQDGANARVSQGFGKGTNLKATPVFDLHLGKGKPYSITIDAGANDDSYLDFGGLSLSNVEIHHGAGKINLDFSTPTAQPMDKLHVSCGASDTRLKNLANANAQLIAVDTGAASLSLEFGGTLTRDSNVTINSGLASVSVSIPGTTAAKITTKGFLGGIEPSDGFTTQGGAFLNDAAVKGLTPSLNIEASVNLSSFKFIST